MLTRASFPNITKRTVELRETIAQLKTGVLVLAWFDPVRGMQIWPVGDESAIRPETPIYQRNGCAIASPPRRWCRRAARRSSR